MKRLILIVLVAITLHPLRGQTVDNTITPFLMFEGEAEEAMNFYVSLFDNSEITEITRYKAGEAGREGSVMLATFVLNGMKVMCIDSPGEHPFSFTPSISLYVSCTTEEEVERLFNELSEGGQVLMPLNSYPFSEKYSWVNDRFGVSWQLSLQKQGNTD
jgi:predicted 3-demethylubiquinone-9 3-methyltransferase (glyoxalase superfamily)